MILKIQKLHENAVIPQLATTGAACVDVVATSITHTPGTNEALVKLGFSLEIPNGYKVCLAPRSSFTAFNWILQNSPAQIDSDYRGEIMLKFKAIPSKTITLTAYGEQPKKQPVTLFSAFPYKVGDRVAQMWVEQVINISFEEVTELSDSFRGKGGFGSTGI
jgi:dUTP pyrophosphatase